MSNTTIEQDCTVTHEGREYSALGAMVSDEYLVAYPSLDLSGKGTVSRLRYPVQWRILRDWHGNKIGGWYIVSSRPAIFFGHRSPYASRYYYMRARLNDGREYALRGFGAGMVARGKRIKAQR